MTEEKKKRGRPRKIESAYSTEKVNELQNTDLVLPGDLGDVTMGNGDTRKIEKVFKGKDGSVTLTIGSANKDNRKVLNPEADKTKQMKEPAEGTPAYFLRYGAFFKKDIQK